jgi:RHS repeat-associated protein
MKHFPFPFTLALVFTSFCPLRAQVGNNNPSGASGIFNGQVNTGCSYDPYTGNATRSITDIAVAGTVSEYPLALVRAANSRTPSTTGVFGWHGGWNHNYNWTMEDSPVGYTQNFSPTRYTVNFPDGRVETFRAVTWDTIYRVRATNGGDTSSAGVRERFLQLNLNNMYAYLILPDGGAVEFRAQQYYDPAYGRYWYKYHVTGIYDPHGLKTTIDSEVVGTIRRITRVTEPAGRYLQFTYDPNARRRITQITEYINGVARRSVQYNYTYSWLSSVVYYGNNAWTASYQYTGSNIGGDMPLLLRTCDDPMYPGPMHKIAYIYRTTDNYTGNHPVYGQISSENYFDGTAVGAAISTLTVPSATTRIETRGDTVTRSFTYTTDGYLTNCTDFMSHSASQGYDNKKYVNYVTDRRGNRTDYINDPITGNVLQIRFPFTHEDTLNQSVRPTINYIYGGAGCPDSNNQDPYWVCTATDEAGNQTQFTRDPVTYRVTRIDYPDGGWETFSYDASHFYQLQSHRMVTGGTENWTYDSRHRKDTYRNPDSPSPSPSPSAQYYYDTLDRVRGITDALNHSTNFDYNDRGQLTLTTLPWFNGTRYTIRNVYYDDGTLRNTTDQLNHITSYTYDDYRRLKSVTTPNRYSGDTTNHTTRYYYGANFWDSSNDYKLTDSNVTWVVLPSLKKAKIVYDDNRRGQSVTVGYGSGEDATTNYGYDYVGNVTSVTNPLDRNNVSTLYDERNRPYSISVRAHTTTITYDTAGRTKTVTRPNGQTITSDTFDQMNRVTQRTASQTPDPNAVTTFSYYPSGPVGLLNTIKDPHLAQLNNGEAYTYIYDPMGRKKKLTYPKDNTNTNRYEQWTYDAAGRLSQFRNRAASWQTFTYDTLNRMTDFSWDDGVTPSVHFDYDAAFRLTGVTNRAGNNNIASISRVYWNDNLLRSETETPTGGVATTVSYAYDADGNRHYDAGVDKPGTKYANSAIDYTFNYDYTGRNQLWHIYRGGAVATYVYDQAGSVSSRTLNNSTSSTYLYNIYDRPTWITHTLNGTTRSFDYGYYDDSNNREFVRRLGSSLGDIGDVFRYDRADQAISFQLNVATPQNVDGGSLPRMVFYDPNGNRTSFTAADTYDPTNNLNQYTNRTKNNHTYSAGYNVNGNLTASPEATSLASTYDAQNRLTQAIKNGVTMNFVYDGLNRQVKRIVAGGANPGTFFSVWDGWNLVSEYHKSGNTAVEDASYVYGPTGLIKNLKTNNYYYQDGSASTSHLVSSDGTLLEWYRYDLQGTPVIYGYPGDQQISASTFGVRHLFTGQQWYNELGLYDLRNRFYSPDLGRFLQPDPIGFWGGDNLYRYCRNNPITRWDPFGLQVSVPTNLDGTGAPVWHEGDIVDVTGSDPNASGGGTGAPSGAGGGGGGGEAGGRGGSTKLTGITFSYGKPTRKSNSNTQQQPPGIMVGFDIYHPTTTAEFIIAGNIIEHGDTTDTTVQIDLIEILSGGIAGLTRGFVRTAAPAAQQRTITVLGSRRAIEAGAYVTRPRFNVFRPAANMTKQEIDRANAEWLNAALVRGDEIWLVTHPEQHARFLQSLPPGAFESSNYIHLELPMLEHYKAVESIIAY